MCCGYQIKSPHYHYQRIWTVMIHKYKYLTSNIAETTPTLSTVQTPPWTATRSPASPRTPSTTRAAGLPSPTTTRTPAPCLSCTRLTSVTVWRTSPGPSSAPSNTSRPPTWRGSPRGTAWSSWATPSSTVRRDASSPLKSLRRESARSLWINTRTECCHELRGIN